MTFLRWVALIKCRYLVILLVFANLGQHISIVFIGQEELQTRSRYRHNRHKAPTLSALINQRIPHELSRETSRIQRSLMHEKILKIERIPISRKKGNGGKKEKVFGVCIIDVQLLQP